VFSAASVSLTFDLDGLGEVLVVAGEAFGCLDNDVTSGCVGAYANQASVTWSISDDSGNSPTFGVSRGIGAAAAWDVNDDSLALSFAIGPFGFGFSVTYENAFEFMLDYGELWGDALVFIGEGIASGFEDLWNEITD